MAKVRYYRYRQNVRIGANQMLHYAQGKGYYAGPATGGVQAARKGWAPGGNYGYDTGGPLTVVRGGRVEGSSVFPAQPVRAPKKPVDPFGPLTTAQINARAAAEARGELAPQQAEIRRQQALAEREAEAQQSRIAAFSQASAQMLGEMAPEVSKGYSTAVQDIGDLSQGMSAGIRSDLSAQQAADAAYAAKMGQPTGSEISAAGVGDTTQMLTGVVPGSSLAGMGAAATEAAAAAPQVSLAAGRQELSRAMAAARTQRDDYAQQLIKLAAQFPGLKAQALDALNKYEIDKANYREAVRQNNRNYALQLRAELANEAAASGLTPYQQAQLDLANKKYAAEYKYKYASLRFKTQQAADKAKAAGKQIDVPMSRAVGYVYYKDGTFDKSIKVQQYRGGTGDTHTKALVNKSKAVTAANKTAYETAVSLIGTPVPAKPGPGHRHPQGRYIARPGARGVFPDGTTNDKKKAAKEGGVDLWKDAFAKIWAAIPADQLMAQFNLSQEQVTGYIKNQMRRAGWRFADITAPDKPRG